MCARITVECDVKKLEQLIGMPIHDNTRARTQTWNGPPGALYRVIRTDPERDGGARLDAVRWGLVPRWSQDDRLDLINARSETAPEKASFRRAFVDGRGVLPVTGWYEWQRTGRGPKQPYRIHVAGDETILVAVLCEPPRPFGAHGETFAVLTTESQEGIAHIHDRQPAIIEPENAADWLAGDTRTASLARLARASGKRELVGYPVSRRVNDPANTDRSVADPQPAA